ncbi:ATP-binding protein [Streptomyces smaragdinus]|uniref:ATP-binding protein n=1 Tax=Streptomyces smaragdinus TaxID=2585196 RepID=UPI00129759F2|nr:ATP-binding protein [Streptomyces smaragdinus]
MPAYTPGESLAQWCWPGEVEDATLVVFELVTNAIRHARVIDQDLGLKLLLLATGELVIEVSDPLGAFPNFAEVLTSTPACDRESGRELWFLTLLGAELAFFLRETGGKIVRARLTPLCSPVLAPPRGSCGC